jgi:hypothetical protein
MIVLLDSTLSSAGGAWSRRCCKVQSLARDKLVDHY